MTERGGINAGRSAWNRRRVLKAMGVSGRGSGHRSIRPRRVRRRQRQIRHVGTQWHDRGIERHRAAVGRALADRRRHLGQGHDDRRRRRTRPHRHRLVLRQDHVPWPRPRRQAHRGGRRPQDQPDLPRPQVGRRRRGQGGHHRAGQQERARPSSRPTPTTSASCSTAPPSTRSSPSTAAAAPARSRQGKPYFWGTRAITPNDPLPGLFK